MPWREAIARGTNATGLFVSEAYQMCRGVAVSQFYLSIFNVMSVL